MISFDVSALCPSVPIDIAIIAIEKHLIKFNLPIEELNTYISAIKICMKHNCFQFRGKFYTNDFGCSMGNSLSPFVAEAFMCPLETDLKSKDVLPRIWWKYVDDTFAIIKRTDVDRVLNTINSCYDSIHFTFEKEDDSTHVLPSLDLEIKRVQRNIEFAVYRKSYIHRSIYNQ